MVTPTVTTVDVRTAVLGAGLMGLWDEQTRTIWLDAGLSPTERRSTLAHELVHAERGDTPCADPVLEARQELQVDREAARRLIPLDRLVSVCRWSTHEAEVADDLDVDTETLRVRLRWLSDAERAAVRSAVRGGD